MRKQLICNHNGKCDSRKCDHHGAHESRRGCAVRCSHVVDGGVECVPFVPIEGILQQLLDDLCLTQNELAKACAEPQDDSKIRKLIVDREEIERQIIALVERRGAR